jgi:class 3 adenylate cyclase
MGSVTATFVFTDLVASTELLSRVGEVRADALRREHFGLLRGAVAERGGREVKNLGDGLMVVFDGVTAALDGAVAMQQAIAGRPSDGELVAIRVGIASGEAEFEDGDYFGLPVVEAARLCAKAEGGEILVTGLVRTLARSRSTVVLESVGALELKGLDEPVETYRAVWAPIDPREARPPLPGRLAAAMSGSFVGRASESGQLATAWKAVVDDGDRRVMLVAGEPGIGKTTLAARFATDVFEQGGAVVYGRSDEDLGIPYQPWIETLTQLVAHLPEHVLQAHVADRGAHLARLVPELEARVPVERSSAGDAETERFVLFGCVTDLLARASVEYPVLVVLDDLHWADRPSVQLLRHVATTEVPMRIAVLGTFRDSEVAAGDPVADLLAAMHREGGALRVGLRGLTDLDVLALMETIAGHEMTDDGVALRDALLRETEGNPFFVGEILRHLAETGAIYQQDGRWVADPDLRAAGLPVSVREVVGRRLVTLGADTERVLRLAAVVGRDFDIGLLAAVAQIDEDTLVDLCDAAVTAAVLQPTDTPDRYTFAHALIEHTLYDGLSASRRARAHHAVAEQLETIVGANPGERAGELAYHWAAAVQSTDTSKAIHYAQVAARRAVEQLAPDEAVRWYTEALELSDRAPIRDERERAEILVGLGDAQRQSGIPAYRETLLDAAHLADRLDAVDLLIRAALASNRGFFSTLGDTDHEKLAVIDRALERLDDPDNADRARLLAIACAERLYVADIDELLALADDAIATARRSGDRGALAAAVFATYAATVVPWTLDLRAARAEEARALAEELDDPALRLRANRYGMLTGLERADLAAIRRHAAIIEETAAHVPAAPQRWTAAFDRVLHAILRGDLVEAERLAEAAYTYGAATGQPDALGIFGAQLANIRDHQGRFDELIPLIEQTIVDTPGLPVYQAGLADAIAKSGDVERATTLLDAHVADGLSMTADSAWSTAHGYWADAAVRVRHVVTAERVRERVAPYHDQIVTTQVGIQPAFAHYLGTLDHLLGCDDDANNWFTEAMTIHQRLESPLLIAYTQAAWSALLADRNQDDDHTRARAMADAALTTAGAGGYGYIEADARAVIERLA